MKGYTTVLQFNRFQERRHHDVIGTQSCQSNLETILYTFVLMNVDITNDKCWTLWQWLCYIYKLKSTCNALTWQLMQVLAFDTKTQLRIMAVWNPSHNKNVTQNRTNASPLTSSALLHVYGGSTMCEKVSEPSMLLLHYKAITMDTKFSLPQLS